MQMDTWIDIGVGAIMGLAGLLFTGTCTVFLIFLKSLNRKIDEVTDNFSNKMDAVTHSISEVGIDLKVLVERTATHEKRLDRLDQIGNLRKLP